MEEHELSVEGAYNQLRRMRNRFLSYTDFYALSDSPPITDEMKKYRQELRDLPENTPDPYNVTWPINPDDPDQTKPYLF